MILSRLLSLDASLSKKMRVAENPGPLRTFAAFFAHSGDSWFWLLGLAIVWWLGSDAWKTRAIILGVGIIVTATFVMGIKFAVRRQRPVGEWGDIYRKTDPHSFPSGHAARAAMLAVLGAGLGSGWIAVVLLIWAPLVALARVAMGVHYLLDILAGVAFGGIMGGLILFAHAILFNYL
ncbi:MAG TPA: phosphatase PAP2 family protein [Anaerolineales bacterium]|nr:phosphatase PAP2 family protein [Anaerolineales bacterium]